MAKRTTTTDAGAEGAQRTPQQERGQRRVDAILDATAALIQEVGMEGVTMAAIGQRSGTTTGSLYHFFPDRDCVIRALAERHLRALSEMVARSISLSPADWERLSVEERVDGFLGPLLTYVEAHPDFLRVAHGTRGSDLRHASELYQAVVSIGERVVSACDPAATAEERATRAAVVMATVDGVVDVATGQVALSGPMVLGELRRMLVAYFGSFSLRAPPGSPG